MLAAGTSRAREILVYRQIVGPMRRQVWQTYSTSGCTGP